MWHEARGSGTKPAASGTKPAAMGTKPYGKKKDHEKCCRFHFPKDLVPSSF
eukprot:gene19364-4960_t